MNRRAFTLVELMVGAAVASVLAVAIFALMNAGMILSAKNLSINLTSNSMRTALDRVEQAVQQAETMPQLIDTAGNPVAAGSAAGIRFDRTVGSPYVVTLIGGVVPSTSTSLTLTRTTNSMAPPPVPRAGDVVRLSGTATTLRPHVQSVVAGAVTAALRQPFTVNLTAALGTTVDPIATNIVTANLVRSVAFIVMPANGKPELRYYDRYDTTPVGSLNDPAYYFVVTDQIGTGMGDATPFSIVTYDAKPFVNFSLRVRSSGFDRGIRSLQRDQYNTFARTDTYIRPKILP